MMHNFFHDLLWNIFNKNNISILYLENYFLRERERKMMDGSPNNIFVMHHLKSDYSTYLIILIFDMEKEYMICSSSQPSSASISAAGT